MSHDPLRWLGKGQLAQPVEEVSAGQRVGDAVQILNVQEFEPGRLGVIAVDVGVADVDVAGGFKLVAHIVQVVLAPHEIHVDPVDVPQPLLVGAHPVGAAADHVAPGLGLPHGLQQDRSRRVAALQRAVDIKGDQDVQRLLSHQDY